MDPHSLCKHMYYEKKYRVVSPPHRPPLFGLYGGWTLASKSLPMSSRDMLRTLSLFGTVRIAAFHGRITTGVLQH